MKKVSPFTFVDYRAFLRSWYAQAKKEGQISLRAFSKKAGFTSPNYLKMVMDGDRNLSEEGLAKFALALEFNKQEEEFFKNLVRFTQAKSHEEKDRFYQTLLQSKKFNQFKPIEKEHYEYYSAWYHPVIRELVLSYDRLPSYEELAEQLNPAITPQKAKKSVELLERMGLIRQEENSRWVQATPVVTSGGESDSVVLLNYHQNVLDLAQHHLTATSQEERDVSALTLGITQNQLPEIKRMIQEFRRSILKMVSATHQPEQVVLLTMQLMPVTQPMEAA